jgi:hypothetical protein
MSRPGRFLPPGKYPVPIVQEAGWAPGPVWTGAENLAPTGIRSPERPTPSQSLYRLSYPAHIHPQLNWAILLCEVVPDGITGLTAQFRQEITQASEQSFPVVFHTENCTVHSGNPTVYSVYPPTPHLKALNWTSNKNRQTWWEIFAVSENIHFSYSCSFLHSYTVQFKLVCMGLLTVTISKIYPDRKRLFNFVVCNDAFALIIVSILHCLNILCNSVWMYVLCESLPAVECWVLLGIDMHDLVSSCLLHFPSILSHFIRHLLLIFLQFEP